MCLCKRLEAVAVLALLGSWKLVKAIDKHDVGVNIANL